MAGSADIRGVQHYTLGIGHPRTSVDVTGGDDASPVVLDEGQIKAGLSGQVVGGGVFVGGARRIREEYMAPVLSPAPTITETASQSVGSSLLQANASQYRYSNGLTAPVTGLSGQVGSAVTGRNRNDPTGVAISAGVQWAVEFDYFGQVLEPYLYAAAGCVYWVWVDGRPVTAAPSQFSAPTAALRFLRHDFGSAALRRIRIEGRGVNAAFNGVRNGGTVYVTAPREARPPVLACVFDSYGDGRRASDEMTGFVRRLGRNLGMEAWQFPCAGGQGLVFSSTNPPSRHIDRLATDLFTLPEPSAILVGGSINDANGAWDGAVGPAAVSLVSAIRAQYPSVPIVFLSPLTVLNYPTYSAMSAQIAAALAVAHPDVPYLDYITRQLFTGTGRVGATTGGGISDVAADADGVHPTQVGHDIIADAIAADLRRVLRIAA